jgi:GNAT superfamily N-acetyltransferase
MKVRPLILSEDEHLLWDFLALAAHEDSVAAVKENPQLANYVAGTTDIFGFLALDDQEKPVGAAWVKSWTYQDYGYAFIDPAIPELAISVLAEYRGQGIGRLLLETLLEGAKFPGIVLTCRDYNEKALKLYRNCGFYEIKGMSASNRVGGMSLTMLKLFDHDFCLIRPGHGDDVQSIWELMKEKANFDHAIGSRVSTPFSVTPEQLKLTLYGKQPYAHVLVAQQNDKLIGLAIYYFCFSTFCGRPSMWLEDLYVTTEVRSQGTGRKLMEHLHHVGTKHDCTHIGWFANVRNERGIKFYETLGASVVGEHGIRVTFQWEVKSNKKRPLNDPML